jgi:exopolyphosphatase/guanosine-5'-triphosphate,3'-diphosphate pyrophosphatase
LSLERAEIIVAGIAIVDGVMRRLKSNTIRVHDRGIRDGLILGMIRQFFPRTEKTATLPPDRMRTVRQFAESCRYEKAHSEHVAALAVEVFDQLARRSPQAAWCRPINRELLEAAGVLHDIGYAINYAKHHKHSYHMIVHSDLPGFTHREIEIIANVARYHRRSAPKASHSSFTKLAEADQVLVRRLSGILRIVDGLDRGHSQQVKSVAVRVRGNAAVFRVNAVREPAVDLWGAERKAGLFAKTFGLVPTLEWSGRKAITHARRRAARAASV